MPRQAPLIRDAGPGDAVELLALWALSSRPGSSPRAEEDAELALANLAADADCRLLVVEHEGQIVATMQVERRPLSPLVLDVAMHTSFLFVQPQFRRHGYGHALMEAAVTWAEEKGLNELTVVTDSNRDTNRFFARLGLSTLGTVRHSSVSGLRKKLASERARVRGGGNRHLMEVLAQRRSRRRREASD